MASYDRFIGHVYITVLFFQFIHAIFQEMHLYGYSNIIVIAWFNLLVIYFIVHE